MTGELIAKSAELADGLISLQAAEVDRGGVFPKASVDSLRENLLGACVPQSAGGGARGFTEFAAITQNLARGCASTSMIYIMHVAAAKSIESSKIKDRDAILRSIAKGNHLSSLAASEQGTRSLFWMPLSKLAPKGDGFTVTAKKSWVTAAHHANTFVATAQAPGAESPLVSTCFLAHAKRPGVDRSAAFDGMGLRGNDSAPVVLTDYAVSAEELLCEQGKGFEHLLGVVLPWFLVGTSAMSVGLCQKAVALTTAHLRASKFGHDGSSLAELPNLRGQLARMSTASSAAEALLHVAIRAANSSDPAATVALLSARLCAIETAADVTDRALRACGGAAYSRHTPLERVFRDARAARVMAPTSDHLDDMIGKALLGMELFG